MAGWTGFPVPCFRGCRYYQGLPIRSAAWPPTVVLVVEVSSSHAGDKATMLRDGQGLTRLHSEVGGGWARIRLRLRLVGAWPRWGRGNEPLPPQARGVLELLPLSIKTEQQGHESLELRLIQ